MNYDEALEFIHGTYTFGKKLGLDNIRRLLNILGNPQDKLKFVHVAGTNGKGSTCAMISNTLVKAGYKTGLYISPYLERFNERIQINNTPIPDDDLANVTATVKTAIEELMAQGHEQPSEFEVVTAIALEYYAQQKVDIIVFEVGMGGRLDATNIIPDAEAAVIVTLSLEHQQYLGNTLKEIAFEKAGIIKENYDVSVYALNTQEAKDEIKRNADLRHARVYFNNPDFVEMVSSDIDGQVIKYKNSNSPFNFSEYRLSLLGKHQMYNSLNALTALEILKRKGWNISDQNVLDGFASVKFTGRFEILCKKPIIVIDGGHNIEGITSFVNNIKLYFNEKKVVLFYGMLSDKQVDQSVDLLSTIAKEIHTLTPHDKRAVGADDMSEYIKRVHPDIPTIPLHDIKEAEAHIDFSKKDEIYAFTGSLYMIGEARTFLNELIAKKAQA